MPPPKKIHILKQEDFDRLLAWLDEDRERAGLAYEKIRWRLVTIFAARSCPVPEELADETIDRVARRVADIEATYVGDKLLYFLGVANYVHHEYLKRPLIKETAPVVEDADDKEQTHYCLENCINNLPEDSGLLIRRYYAEDKQAKIDLRKLLADELDISVNTLRARALRIREKLQACIEKCLAS
jgi:DNA-directed RNA polymerase specialized sigma24 family protein